LGKDYSGNGNNWTPNNFSVSAGAGNDSLVDVPTNWGVDTGVGGTVRGNYATLNPLDYSPYVSLLNGNLDYTISSNQKGFRKATISASSGKWYAECLMTSSGNIVGIATADTDPMAGSGYVGATSTSWGYDGANGRVYNNAASSAYGATYTTNDVIGIALDLDAGTLVFYKNGTSQGTAATGLSGTFTFATGQGGSGVTGTFNFGQRPFAYTAPSGFKALNTQNLPTPTIGATPATQANQFFAPTIYTGNGANNRTITTGLQSDFVWIKNRSNVAPHLLFDVIRGAGQTLYSNLTNAEVNNGTSYVQQFNSNNFLLGVVDGAVNGNGENYVSWVWKANGTGVTNTAGSITSTVSANTTSGFSVVRWTQPGSGTYTIGHGLGAAPAMIIMKSTTLTNNWAVYHRSLGFTQYGVLNTTTNFVTDSSVWVAAPTSSVFSQLVNYGTGGTSVAYCFAEVPGYSKFGSFVGNGSADGPMLYLGFRPAWFLYKDVTTSEPWVLLDSTRSPSNIAGNYLVPNSSDAEGFVGIVDFLSNGVKIRFSGGSLNVSGRTYIFAAFAQVPQKFALAR
jgi:hypothetical protein